MTESKEDVLVYQEQCMSRLESRVRLPGETLCHHARPFTVHMHHVASGGAVTATDWLHECVNRLDFSKTETLLRPVLMTPSTLTNKLEVGAGSRDDSCYASLLDKIALSHHNMCHACCPSLQCSLLT